jgi:hypothetical protein
MTGKRKAARPPKKPERRKEPILPYDRKDPRQLKLMLTLSDEYQGTRQGEKK